MYQSRFILPVKLPSTDEYVLFSTSSKSVVKIDGETYSHLQNEDWEKISPTDLDCLKNMGFLVESLDDEKSSFMNKVQNESRDGTHFNLHLLATTSCNFRCGYCFQDGVEHHSFKADEIDTILNPLKEYLKEYGVKTLSLVLYGGEPTLNWNFTKDFINALTIFLKRNSVQYDTEIITNGYALTEDKLAFLALHNCKKIQITLDGCKEMHDSRRVLANGGPTFDKIISNIHIALDNNYIDKVSIRLNYDKQNVDNQIELLDYLAHEFDTNRILISLGWVTNAAKEPTPTVYTHDTLPENKEHIDAYISLHTHAKKMGFKMKNYYIYNGVCISKRNQAVLVCSDGNYYKCGGLIGREEHSVGKVGSELAPVSYHYPDLYESCFDKNCEMLPLCHAGCRLESFYRSGDLHSHDCKYELVKGINLELIKRNYTY